MIMASVATPASSHQLNAPQSGPLSPICSPERSFSEPDLAVNTKTRFPSGSLDNPPPLDSPTTLDPLAAPYHQLNAALNEGLDLGAPLDSKMGAVPNMVADSHPSISRKALHTPNTSDLDVLERAESTPNLTSSPEALMGPRFSLRRSSGRRPLSILSSSSMNSDLSHQLDPLLESLPLKTGAGLEDQGARVPQNSRHQRHRSMLGSSLDRITPNLGLGGVAPNLHGFSLQHSTPGNHTTPINHSLAFDPPYDFGNNGSAPADYRHSDYHPTTQSHLASPQYIYRDQYPHYGLPPPEFFTADPYAVHSEEHRNSTCLTPFLERYNHPIDTDHPCDAGNSSPTSFKAVVNNGSPFYPRQSPQLALRTRSCPNGLPGLNVDPYSPEFSAHSVFESPVSPLCTVGKNSYEQIEAANETMQDMLVRLAAKERQVLEAKQRWKSLCDELNVYRRHCDTNLVPHTGRIVLPIKPSIIARRHHPNIGLNSLHYKTALPKHWHPTSQLSPDAVGRACVSAKYNRAFNVRARQPSRLFAERPQILVWKIDSEVPLPSQSETMDTVGGLASAKSALAHQRYGIAYYVVKCLLGVVHCVITTLPVHQREFSFPDNFNQLVPEYPMPMDVLFGHLNGSTNNEP